MNVFLERKNVNARRKSGGKIFIPSLSPFWGLKTYLFF